MFIDPKAEDRLCDKLKAFVEEFGPEAVTVYIPQQWFNEGYSLGPTKLAYHDEPTVKLEVNFFGNVITYAEQLEQ